jgi:hypothetical protein
MNDALQWVIDLMLFDLGAVAVGLVVLALTIEMILWIKEHLP